MKIFSEAILSLWNKCELRVLVLLSLLWQVILIILGPMRKHKRGAIKDVILSFVIWVTYLSADWLATVALGNLATNQIAADTSNSKAESKDQVLQALWAPFLLLHLGGPDTITAYSLEDNSLWRRHLLGLIVQVSVAFYIFLRSWSSNNALTFVAIPVFVSGIIKYSERTWVLRSATSDQFENSLPLGFNLQSPNSQHVRDDPKLERVHVAYSLFKLLQRLYANLFVPINDGTASYSLVKTDVLGEERDATSVFKLVEMQLEFLFDVLYTKTTIIYTKEGLFVRLVSAFSISSAMVAFILVIDRDDSYYSSSSRVDVVITYILFVGAVFLELYSLVSLIFSVWTLVQMWSCLKKFVSSCIISLFRLKSRCMMGQLSVVDLIFLLTKGTTRKHLFSFSKILLPLEFNVLRSVRLEEVNTDVKQLIFRELQKKGESYQQEARYGRDLTGELLRKTISSYPKQDEGYEFGHAVFIFHFATDLLYHSNLLNEKDDEAKLKRERSKKISDYLFYLLLQHPSMLPPFTSRITHIQETLNEVKRLFPRGLPVLKDTCTACIDVEKFIDVVRVGRNFNRSIHISPLIEACRLVTSRALDSRDHLNESWMRYLIYAASKCDWVTHAQQLTSGGEFLTHVALLMTDFGFLV